MGIQGRENQNPDEQGGPGTGGKEKGYERLGLFDEDEVGKSEQQQPGGGR